MNTDAQTAALENEAIEAAAVAIAEFHIEFMGARKTTATLARVTSASMKQAAAAVRAAAPIIRRQAEAERDALAQLLDARLADAERYALLQAADEADEVARQLVRYPEPPMVHGLKVVAERLRELAKTVTPNTAGRAEPGGERGRLEEASQRQ